MNELLTIEIGGSTNHVRAALRGELDGYTAPMLWERLEPTLGATRDVELDCNDLGFVDSEGLAVLIRLAQQLGDRGRLVLRSPRAHVTRLLEITGMGTLMDVA